MLGMGGGAHVVTRFVENRGSKLEGVVDLKVVSYSTCISALIVHGG